MSTGWEHPEGRERRAIDGLDWARDPANPAATTAPPQSPLDDEPPPPSAPPSPARERGAGLGAVALVAGVAALVGGLVAGLSVALVSGDGDSTTTSPADSPRTTLSVEQTSAIADVAAKTRPGVVRVESTKRAPGGSEQDIGSGIVIDAQGHVITNAHVVLNTDSLRVVLSDGTERPAILLGHDFPFTDLAVLQIGPGKLTPIEAGDSGLAKLGQTVVAIGNPLAEFDGSVSVGVISGTARSRTFDGVRQDDLLQTDAAVNNGNSGGALLNLQGQFIGMPTAVLRQSRSGAHVEGIAFALPSNRVMAIAEGIIAAGGQYPRPTLGIEHLDIGAEVLQRLPRLGVSEGALVTALISGGPADAAGIQTGDVVTKFGNEPVTRDHPFLNALMTHEAGETVKVVLNRNGRIIEAEVRLARRS